MAGSGVLARRWVSCLAQLPFLLLLLVAGCGGGGEGSAPSTLLFRFIVGADQLPALLAQSGVVLLAAGSKYETQPFGFVNGAVLVDVDAWADFSFTADHLVDYPARSGMIGQLGIGNRNRVVIYDDGELTSSRHGFVFCWRGG